MQFELGPVVLITVLIRVAVRIRHAADDAISVKSLFVSALCHFRIGEARLLPRTTPTPRETFTS